VVSSEQENTKRMKCKVVRWHKRVSFLVGFFFFSKRFGAFPKWEVRYESVNWSIDAGEPSGLLFLVFR